MTRSLARLARGACTALGLLAVTALAGCAPATGLAVVRGTSRSAGSNPLTWRARDLGPVHAGTGVSLLLLLHNPAERSLEKEIVSQSNPSSGDFGHSLSPGDLERYGPPASEVRLVRRLLRARGLQTAWAAGDSWITVRGKAARISRVFDVPIHRFRMTGGRTFVAGTRDPAVPTFLHGFAGAVTRVESYRYIHARDVPTGGLAPSDFLKAYDIAPLRSAGMTGAGETVVFFEIDGFDQSDLDRYTSRFNLPRMHPVIRAGPRLQPGGEAEMDLEVVHAIAPGAKLVVYDLDQDALTQQAQSDSEFLDQLIGFQRTIVNGSAKAIVSNSVGSCAGALGRGAAEALRGIYDRADALGETWFAASGDQGAYDCLQAEQQSGTPPSNQDIGVDLPASAPGVTGVGGTRLAIRQDGTWYTEEAWEGPAETSGGGGGVSGFFGRPSWQRASGVGNVAFDQNGRREVPDVSAVADPGTSGAYSINGSFVREGGTSQAAPIWAGITALINQYLRTHGGKRVGFANPALYALARSAPAYPPFHDVTVGSNLVYPATPGYDMATGLGTPDAWNLARDLLAYQAGGTP